MAQAHDFKKAYQQGLEQAATSSADNKALNEIDTFVEGIAAEIKKNLSRPDSAKTRDNPRSQPSAQFLVLASISENQYSSIFPKNNLTTELPPWKCVALKEALDHFAPPLKLLLAELEKALTPNKIAVYLNVDASGNYTSDHKIEILMER